MSKVIGIVGSRKRDFDEDFKIVRETLLKLYTPGDSICSGLCSSGADRFAVIIADELELPKDKRIWFPAKWNDLEAPNALIKYNKYGKAYNARAGFARNIDIAINSDILIACVSYNRIGGTEDTIRKWRNLHKGKVPILV